MAFGEEIYYGVESVELVPAPAGTARIVLAMLVVSVNFLVDLLYMYLNSQIRER